jgi:integrase
MRCRETISLPPTRKNIQYANNLLGEIKGAIERDTFQYARYFPNSKKLNILGKAVAENKTIGDYLDDFQASAVKRGLSPSTLTGYYKLKLALRELHALPVKQLTPARLKQFVKESGNSPKTLRNKFSYLRSALAEAVTDGLINTNPVDGIKLSNYVEKDNKLDLDDNHRDVKPFSPDEIGRIYKACKPDEINIVKFAMCTGLRPSEWSSLKWPDIDLDNAIVTVKGAIVHGIEKGTKSKAGRRVVPLNQDALSALRSQMEQSYLAGSYVFAKKSKAPVRFLNGELNRINPDSFRKHKWTKILDRAKVEYRYPYQMRHTFATSHISSGVNLWQLANWMGHSSPEMLFRHYGKFMEEHESKAQYNDTLKTQKIKLR